MSISRESEFIRFMRQNGPPSEGGKRNYISWLRYVAENIEEINEVIDDEKIDNIYIRLKETQITRQIYTSDSAVSDIKSALNKYLTFINTTSPFSAVTDDLESILGELRTSKKQEVETRIGQGKYRKELIKLWGKCSVTKYSNTDFLIASHIKPWRTSTGSEKIDPYNGLLLLPSLDRVFDKGYISFTGSGEIIISKFLNDTDLKHLCISKNMKLYKIHEENQPYLKFHRESILLK